MATLIREGDTLRLAQLLTDLAAVNLNIRPDVLDQDEVALVIAHRRGRITKDLANLGIEVRPDLQRAEAVAPAQELGA